MAEQSGIFMDEKWKYDIYAETDGFIALIPFGEIKTESRRFPKIVSHLVKFSNKILLILNLDV